MMLLKKLGDAAARKGMECGKQAQKDVEVVIRSKEFHDLVQYASTLDPENNVQVRKDLMAIDEQMLRLAAEAMKAMRRGKESHVNDR